MKRDDIINMALEAGFSKDNSGLYNTSDDMTPSLKRFAALVAAAEREACAAACEARKIIDPEYEYDRHYNQGAEHCAFAIRARGEA